MDTDIEIWLNNILIQEIPENVVALNFNLYEDGNNCWSIELVGSDIFDLDDEDWPCNEVFDFDTRQNPLNWSQDATWNKVLTEISEIIKNYLNHGLYANILKKYQAVGISFVDGDVNIIYTK